MSDVIKKGMPKEEVIEEEVSAEINFNSYQEKAAGTALYPKIIVVDSNGNHNDADYIYPAMGLGNEAGEVLGKLKKIVRDHQGRYKDDKTGEIYDMAQELVASELGDVLWYLAETARVFNVSLSRVAEKNLEKLESRKARGKLQGSGDNR